MLLTGYGETAIEHRTVEQQGNTLKEIRSLGFLVFRKVVSPPSPVVGPSIIRQVTPELSGQPVNTTFRFQWRTFPHNFMEVFPHKLPLSEGRLDFAS